jgi:hypothetical protein
VYSKGRYEKGKTAFFPKYALYRIDFGAKDFLTYFVPTEG